MDLTTLCLIGYIICLFGCLVGVLTIGNKRNQVIAVRFYLAGSVLVLGSIVALIYLKLTTGDL
jgi:hypothetical protein